MKPKENVMLYLKRKIGESVMINNHVKITVESIKGKHVHLSFLAFSDARILRQEIFDRVQEENKKAAASALQVQEFLVHSEKND